MVTMNMENETYAPPRYAKAWRAIHDRINWEDEKFAFSELVNRKVDFTNIPDGAIGIPLARYFRYKIWANGEENDLAEMNLKLGYERGQEALAANAFELVTTGHLSKPWGKKSFLEASILLDALYERRPLSQAAAIELAEIEAQLAPNTSAAYWDGTAQGGYQFAIDLLLLTEAWPQAQSLVDQARSMRALNVKEPFRAAKLILKHKSALANQLNAHLAYRQALDILRNPDINARPQGQGASMSSLFVMACIWQKFFVPGEGTYNYDKAIDLLWA